MADINLRIIPLDLPFAAAAKIKLANRKFGIVYFKVDIYKLALGDIICKIFGVTNSVIK